MIGDQSVKRADARFLVSSPSVPTSKGVEHYSSTTTTSPLALGPTTTPTGPTVRPGK